MLTRRLLSGLCGLCLLGLAPAAAEVVPNPPAPVAPATFRDARYCEVLPVTVGLDGMKARVYNTIGYDDCPEAAWKGIADMPLRREFGAVSVILNGPRHFLMDRILARGASARGEVISLNGILFEQRAELSLSPMELFARPYSEHKVARETTYVFVAGQPTYRLTAPDGAVYVMQSYALMEDPGLTYAALPTLGAKLKLPEGWRYGTVVPDSDLSAGADGVAIVIQDNLKNTYQKLTPSP